MRSTTLPKTWIFFFVIVMILVIASLWQTSNKSHIKTAPSQTASEDFLPPTREANAESMLKNGDNSIYVTDQFSGASKMSIGYAVFSKPGFITIRDDDHGMPGKIIGTSALLSGRVDHPEIELSTKLTPDAVYYAELNGDDGDGLFDESKDMPVGNKEKSVVLMSFLAKTNVVSTAP